jgi:large subunit ribosomal protein L9
MANQLLLLEDVDSLGRSGDIVKVRPGYARNFLLPKKKAVVADKRTLRMQAKLKEERAKQSLLDKEESDKQAARIEGMVLTIETKVDAEGHMYGSVSALDIVDLFAKEGITLEKRTIVLAHPLKQLGDYPLSLRLKEGVTASFQLKVVSDLPLPPPPQDPV